MRRNWCDVGRGPEGNNGDVEECWGALMTSQHSSNHKIAGRWLVRRSSRSDVPVLTAHHTSTQAPIPHIATDSPMATSLRASAWALSMFRHRSLRSNLRSVAWPPDDVLVTERVERTRSNCYNGPCESEQRTSDMLYQKGGIATIPVSSHIGSTGWRCLA